LLWQNGYVLIKLKSSNILSCSNYIVNRSSCHIVRWERLVENGRITPRCLFGGLFSTYTVRVRASHYHYHFLQTFNCSCMLCNESIQNCSVANKRCDCLYGQDGMSCGESRSFFLYHWRNAILMCWSCHTDCQTFMKIRFVFF
jgi:hypothetical protein